jgi:hypothetical protein
MKIQRLLARGGSLLAIAALLSSPAAAQVLGSDGTPDPNFSGFYAWYTASDGCNGAGQPADGTSITLWADKTGQGRDLVRTSSDVNRQAVFVSDGVAGKPSALYDGNDFIWAANSSEFGPTTAEKTIFVVSQSNELPGDQSRYLFDSASGSGRNAVFLGSTTGPDQWAIYPGGANWFSGTTGTLDLEIHTAVFDTNSQDHYINGAHSASGTDPSATLNGLVLGARVNVANGWNGLIAECLVYEGVLSAADIASIEGYLAASYSSNPGTSFCTGDGVATPCPCGNVSTNGGGCANGTGSGAILSGSGAASVSLDSFVLSATGLVSGQPGLYFQANNAINGGAGTAFGDGLRCAGGGVIRLQVAGAGGGGESSTSLSISVKGGAVSGSVFRYQLWYRDPASSPCGATFNLTNGLEIVWQA